MWSLPFPPLVRELPVRLTAKIRQPPARVDLDPAATPPALDRLRPAGPVQSVVQPPLLIPGHGHSRNYSRNHGAVKLPCGVWPPAPAFRSAGGAPAEPLVPPIECRADGVMSHACHGRSPSRGCSRSVSFALLYSGRARAADLTTPCSAARVEWAHLLSVRPGNYRIWSLPRTGRGSLRVASAEAYQISVPKPDAEVLLEVRAYPGR